MASRLTLALAAALLTACGDASKTPPGSDTVAQPVQATRYSAEAFFQTTSFELSSPLAWSTDASKLLIASDQSGTFNVYSLNVNTGALSALTNSTDTAAFPVSWFPADERVLYSADNAGNELDHIFVREIDGSVSDLTPGEGLRATFLDWSGDRRHFYIATNERDPAMFDLYRYNVKDYQREPVYENSEALSIDAISPDGRWLALRRENSSADTDLFLFDLSQPASAPRRITDHTGQVKHYAYTFTPDSRGLVYGTDEHSEFLEAWTYDIASGEKQPRLQAEWDVVSLGFSTSGKYQVAEINEDASRTIRVTRVKSGAPVQLPQLPRGQLAQLRFTADDSRLALMISTDVSPRDIFLIDLAKDGLQRLTEAANPAIDENELVSSEIVRYQSFDGLSIPAILYRPKDASASNPVPALVWVHGGPGSQSTTGYVPMIQHLVNHGYAVLMANNRGSFGYGKTFFHMDDRKHGTVDLDDIVYGGRYLAAQDWVDADRIGVMGGSYGGYIVGAALAFRPGAFKVGINIFGVMNWVRTLESIPPYWAAFRARLYDELGDPATDRERLLSVSPLTHASNIKTPLLVVQGANDPRVLKIESDEIVAAVRANGVPVEYLVFDDEGHGFSQRANRIAASKAYLRFLETYL
jgi:dipeptidyl aminopeptidase/acylaminoacyl peptidase